MRVALDELRRHVVVAGFDDDDALLLEYAAAAEQWVINYLRRNMDADFPGGWPWDVQQAVKILVMYFYERDTDDSPIPASVYQMLGSYRSFA